MLLCTFCQFENEDGALFCEQCKQDLTPATSPPVVENFDPSSPVEVEIEIEATSATPDHDVDHVEQDIPEEVRSMEPTQESVPSPDAPETPDTESSGAITEPVSESDVEPETEPTAPPTEPARGMTARPEEAEPSAEPEPTPTKTSTARPKLVVLRGERIDIEYVLYDGANYIGRTDDKPVDIDLENQEPPDQIWTSRQHAVIILEGDKLYIEDLNSLNGTFVNRSRIYAGQRMELQDQDVVQIGKVQMRVALG